MHACDVCLDRCGEARFTQLTKYGCAKFSNIKRCRAERNERLGPSFLEMLTRRARNPLSKHCESTACLLILRQRLPFSLKYRKRCRVKRIAISKPLSQKVARLHFCRCNIHSRPFWRQLRATL